MPWRDPQKQRDHVIRMQGQRRLLIAMMKQKPCTDCGGTFHWSAMQWDHVRGVKLFNIGENLSFALSRILDEIDKCELVCASCHAFRTWQRLQERNNR